MDTGGSVSQSSVGGQGGEGTDNFKIDVGSPLWRHTTRISQVSGGGSYYWKCNYCQSNKGKPFNSSYSRVKLHFMGPAGKGFGMCKGTNGTGMTSAEILSFVREQEAADALINRSKKSYYQGPSSKSKPKTPTEPMASSQHPFLQVPVPEEDEEEVGISTRKRGPLHTAFKMGARDRADEAIARCLYANGLSFNLVRSPYWKEMVAAIKESPADYTSPGYEKLRTTLLQQEKAHIERALQPIKKSWKTSGLTIVSDGWKDTRNRPLINVIAISPKGAMFLKAIDCEGQVKDSEFISRILIEAIEMVGSENVVQVVTDNAKNCRGAGALVESRYDHIFWTPCTVHSLNLILQRIGTEVDWVKKIYEEGEDIQMFVTNHHMSQSIFRTYSKLELLKVN